LRGGIPTKTAMALTLNKADFLMFVPFSQNISEEALQPFIKDALKMDVKPLLGDMWAAVQQGTQQFTDSEGDDLVKGYWVVSAFERMIQVHGINVTQAGLTKTKGDSYEQASQTDRSGVQHYLRTKLNYYEGALRKQVAQSGTPGTGTRNGIGLYVRKR
jgi:hypothetical protein